MEHGYQGRYYDTYEIAKKYNLKFIFGVEAYWVKDRFSKDKTNGHICIFAKNEQGRRQINSILSDANIEGYYYKPRLDLELIFSLNPKDVFVTTACIAFWKYKDIEDIVLKLNNHFKDNFMLEVQYHNTDKQKNLNQIILLLSKKYNIPIIMGCDSHYIYPEQEQDREYVLEAKNIRYEDEDGWYMDYPDGKTAIKRFQEQGILNDKQICEAMNNTNIFLDFEDIEFDKDIKLPTLYPELTQQERNIKYAKLVAKQWQKFKEDIPEELHELYQEEIKKEVKAVIETNMSDYFLLDYEIVKDAIAHGGVITPTGRGSAVSFVTNTLLGFSKVDRIASPVRLYPERFLSKTRILSSKSLPDLDLNCGNPEVFAKSQEKILGKGHSYPMIAFGTFKAKAAWKMYAKANDISFDISNEISNQIENYEEALKYAEDDEKDLVQLYDFIDEKYHNLVKESEKYQGITSDKKAHACGYLIYQGDIKEEIGLIKCKSESTKKETITTVIDGNVAEKYKFLKNDLLKVDVVMLIDKVYKRAGVKPHTVKELHEITRNDKKVWDIYRKGLTLGINQTEKEATMQKVMRYQPKNISELTAFIAAIRPGFISMYNTFEKREPFKYNIPSFDKLIQTEEMPHSFILYQEMIMAALNYAGIPMDETYGIIKAISKKRESVILETKEVFIKGFAKHIQKDEKTSLEKAIEISNKVWQIIQDSMRYLFNASHAYSVANDSLYGAYLKANYPLEFYEVHLEYYSKKGKKDKVMDFKKEMQKGFGIKIGDIKFGLDNRGFKLDKENYKINQSILSMKYMNYKISNELYKLSRDKQYNNFIDLLIDIKEKTSIDSRQLNILISIDYFRDFAGGNKILKFIDIFNEFYGGKEISKDKANKWDIKHEDIIQFSRLSDTGKTYMDFQDIEFLKYIWNTIPNEDFTIIERIQNELEYLGYANTTDSSIPMDCAIITKIDTNKWGTKFLTLYRPNNGDIETVKIYKNTFETNLVEEFEMIKTISLKTQNKRYKKDGKWQMSDEKEDVLYLYSKVIV